MKAEEAAKKVEAALPKEPFAKPKKARTMLVIESLHGMSHNTIPHTNLMLQKFGEKTGAWKTVFDNDLTQLLPANIKKYDAIFLNDIVGEAFADPAVRESLLNFVKNGGGLIGKHGTPWASRNWNEFTEMIGAMDAPHRIENGVMRVYDPASPLVKMFDGKPLPFKEEYYRFLIEGNRRLRWNNVRVLLTVDLDDPAIEPRPWGRLQAVGQDLPGVMDSHLWQGPGLLHLDRPHAGDVHDTVTRGSYSVRRDVRAGGSGRRCDAQSAGRGQRVLALVRRSANGRRR